MLHYMVKEGPRCNTNKFARRSHILQNIRLAVDGLVMRLCSPEPVFPKVDATTARQI